jgi:hypothetical protein
LLNTSLTERLVMLRSSHRRFAALVLAAAPLAVATSGWAESNIPSDGSPERARPARVEADQAASTPSTPTSYQAEPFTIDATAGYQSTDLTTFRGSLGARAFTASVIPSQLSGPTAQLGFGWRFYALSLGLRGGVAWLDSNAAPNTLTLYDVDAEIGLKLPFERIEVSLLFGGGYSVIGGLSDLLHGLGQGLDIDGANLRFAVGVDYYFSRYFSIGARGTAQALFLSRHGVALRDIPNQVASFDSAQSALLAGDGTSVGSALSLTAGPGFHF